MKENILSVTIPTFDRPISLARTLERLIPQCKKSRVPIVILDNHSSRPVKEILDQEFADWSDCCTVIRNRANVGANSNICRCFEMATTPWIWILGDDDEISDTAVSDILACLEHNSEIESLVGINFSTNIWKYPEDAHLETIQDYWATIRQPLAFSNALFISSCVFKREALQKYLSIAYQFTFSCATQLVIPLKALQDGHSMAVSAITIANNQTSSQETWNHFSVFSGIPILAELPGDLIAINELSSSIEYFTPGLHFTSGVRLIFLDQSRGPGYWYIYFSRMVPLLKGKKAVSVTLLRSLACLSFRFPLARQLGSILLSSLGIKSPETAMGQNRL